MTKSTKKNSNKEVVMKLYCGIDLHSNNSVVAVLGEQDQVIYQQRLDNKLETIIQELLPYKERLQGIVVESTYNWYWLVDGLMDFGFTVLLANTAAIIQYDGLKYSNDNHDARWLAHMLRLGILKVGYIYPIGLWIKVNVSQDLQETHKTK